MIYQRLHSYSGIGHERKEVLLLRLWPQLPSEQCGGGIKQSFPVICQLQSYILSLNGGIFCRAVTAMNLPPAWVDISDQVSADMQRARGKMAELSKAHSRALMPTFDDSLKEEHTIELLSQQITKLLKKCEQKLQQLSKGTGPSEQDASIRKNVQVSIHFLQDVGKKIKSFTPVLGSDWRGFKEFYVLGL